MKTIWIMQGISGSGKSTLVEWIDASVGLTAKIVSADQYFTRMDGGYQFDPKKLGEAHQYCWDEFRKAVMRGDLTIVVDNTNITRREYMRYVRLGRRYGYRVVKATLMEDDIGTCYTRNEHNVPLEVIERQHDKLFIAPTHEDVFRYRKAIHEYVTKMGQWMNTEGSEEFRLLKKSLEEKHEVVH